TSEEAASAHTDATSGATSALKQLNEDGTYSAFGAGDIHFADVNNDGIIDSKDKQVIGNPNPDFYGSFTTSLSINKLTVSAALAYSIGNDVYNYSRSQLESGSTLSNQTSTMLTRWTGEGQVTNQPKAVYGDPMGNARFSDRWIEDGSYLRLKNVKVSYKIPLKSSFIESFDVWASASNLVTLTKYLGIDPECSSENSALFQGIDNGLLPLTQSCQVGFKLNL
ncbi:MAG: SusC/RagA family TonB-linked outer membrane protein, partial [Bacteroidota bacterium]|nr:SusC/RagA family TonB-linked outer membrane protein [Bacteroidota bacterium]